MIDQADNVIDLTAILYPGSVYDHPREVVADPNLSSREKRVILASWASDAAAVASNPALRELQGSRRSVTIDEVLEALAAASRPASNHPRVSTWQRDKVEMPKMIDEKLALLRSCRNNIRRYRNLLKTNLADLERQFIERGLAEEPSATEKAIASTFPLPLDRQAYRSMRPRSWNSSQCSK